MGINRVEASGNLTRDCETRTTASGTMMVNFTVAVNKRQKNSEGVWEDKPNYVDCTMYGQRAQALSQYLVKGLKVVIDGELDYRSWKAPDGSNRSKLGVLVHEVELMGEKVRKLEPEPVQVIQQAYPQAQVDAYAYEDIPF